MEEINRQLNEQEYLDYIERWKLENKEIIESGKCKNVFLECLPRWEKGGKAKEGSINWNESVGYKVYFIYDYLEDSIIINNYVKESRHPKLTIKYKNKLLNIYIDNFKKCQLGIVLKRYTGDHIYNINEIIKDEKRDMTIIDKEYRNDKYNKQRKWYKYKCNKCGWDNGWIVEHALVKGNGCSCCKGNIVVEGINDIPTTNPWMIKYFQGGIEEAKLYTCNSNSFIFPICPSCGQVKNKKITINNIFTRHVISCPCSDLVPYGEKFMFDYFKQNNIDFIMQLSKKDFKWCQNYKYDFFFENNGEQYICEINGLQHYRDCNWSKLEKTQENDTNKKELALVNGIKSENYIVINCKESTLKWIRDNDEGILNSKLAKLFDLSKIDWLKAEEYACSNLVKKACEIKRDNLDMTTTQIGKKMGISNVAVINYLKRGNEIWNWANYNPKEEMRKIANKNRLKKKYLKVSTITLSPLTIN